MNFESELDALSRNLPLPPARPVAGVQRIRALLHEIESADCPDPLYHELVAQWRREGRAVPESPVRAVPSDPRGAPAIARHARESERAGGGDHVGP